jgi:hypothetical protein
MSALTACVARGTSPSVADLICAPVSDLGATFAAVTARRASFVFVTAPFLSCLAPTLFLGSLSAA